MNDFWKSATPWLLIASAIFCAAAAVALGHRSREAAKKRALAGERDITPNPVKDTFLSLGMCAGTFLGMMLGQYVLDNVIIGMCIGMFIGTGIGSFIPRRGRK